MGLAEIKNDVKSMFLILNTLFGLLPGLLPISGAIAFLASPEVRQVQYDGAPTIIGIILLAGILILAVTVLGYCGAIKENKVMLYIYSGLLALASVGDFIGLMILDPRYIPVVAMMILDLAVMVLTLVLAVILARTLGRRSADRGCVLCPAPTPYTPNI